MLQIKFLDLSKQQKTIEKSLRINLQKVLADSKFIMGPEVRKLESSLESYTNTNYCITCSSGTDALILSLLALDIGKGDIVFCPSFTFPATAEAILMVGATPVFVDVGKNTYNICYKSLLDAIEKCKKKNLNIKAIMPVDLYGLPVNYDKINEIAKSFNLNVIADGAQSFGGEFRKKRVGNLTEITTTSFFPAKPLGCYGDGGAVFTNSLSVKEKLESLRAHGKGKGKYDINYMGMNARLDTIQAAILLEKIKIFDHEIRKRNEFAQMYSESLKEMFDIPIVPNQYKSVWAQYTLRLKNRNKIQDLLKSNNIPTVVYYPKALSQQDGYKDFPCISSGLTNSEELPYEVLSLPMHPYLKEEFIFQLKELLQ